MNVGHIENGVVTQVFLNTTIAEIGQEQIDALPGTLVETDQGIVADMLYDGQTFSLSPVQMANSIRIAKLEQTKAVAFDRIKQLMPSIKTISDIEYLYNLRDGLNLTGQANAALVIYEKLVLKLNELIDADYDTLNNYNPETDL